MNRKSLVIVLVLLALSAISLVTFGVKENWYGLAESNQDDQPALMAPAEKEADIKQDAISGKNESEPDAILTSDDSQNDKESSSSKTDESDKKIKGQWMVESFSFDIYETGVDEETRPKVESLKRNVVADMEKRIADKIVYTFNKGKAVISENKGEFPFKFYDDKLYLWNAEELPNGDKDMAAIFAHPQTQALDYKFRDNETFESILTAPYFKFTTVYHKIADLTR